MGKASHSIADTIGTIVFLTVALGCFYSAWESYRASAVTLSWPQTDGTVVGSTSDYRVPRDGATYYTVTISYKYNIEGKEYENSRWGMRSGLSAATKEETQQLLNKYRPGTSIEVFYDPANPSHSVLLPGASMEYVVFMVFGSFALIPPLIVAVKRRWKRVQS